MTVKDFCRYSGANWYKVVIQDNDETYFKGTIEEVKKSKYINKKIHCFILDGYEGSDDKIITLSIV